MNRRSEAERPWLRITVIFHLQLWQIIRVWLFCLCSPPSHFFPFRRTEQRTRGNRSQWVASVSWRRRLRWIQPSARGIIIRVAFVHTEPPRGRRQLCKLVWSLRLSRGPQRSVIWGLLYPAVGFPLHILARKLVTSKTGSDIYTVLVSPSCEC